MIFELPASNSLDPNYVATLVEEPIMQLVPLFLKVVQNGVFEAELENISKAVKWGTDGTLGHDFVEGDTLDDYCRMWRERAEKEDTGTVKPVWTAKPV
jgi:hypothetical protein